MDVQLEKIEGIFRAYQFTGDTYNKVLHMEATMLRAQRRLDSLITAVEEHTSDGHHQGTRSKNLCDALIKAREQ